MEKSCETQFDSMSQKLLSQELRIKTRALEDLKKDYDCLKVKESELLEKSRWDQGRMKAQEDRANGLLDENDKLREELAEVKKERDKLLNEIAILRRKSTDLTTRAKFESELINYRARIAGLEKKLERRQEEFEISESTMKAEMESLQMQLERNAHHLDSSVRTFHEKENLNTSNIDKLNDLHYKVGDLTATNKSLRDEINRHVSEKAELQQEMKALREEIDSLKGETSVLKDRLKETEGSNDVVSKYYTDEIAKIKQQKAELRCELIRFKRDHEKLLQDKNVDGLKDELAEYKKKVQDLECQCAEAKRTIAEMESSEKATVQQLLDDLKKANDRVAVHQSAMETLDKQAEDLMKRLQAENSSKKAAKKKVVDLEAEIAELKLASREKKMLEEEFAALRFENDRLVGKIAYLENEIRESHTDHREELAQLAKQVTSARSASPVDMKKTEELEKKVGHLESTLRQNENVARSLKRQLDQAKSEIVTTEKTLFEMRGKQSGMSKENTDLRQALHEAITKLQNYKDKEEKLLATNDELQERIDHLESDLLKYKDEISDLQNQLAEKNENIAYLQSIQQPRKLEKLKIVSSESTLVTGAEDESDFDELRAKRDELARQLSERKKLLEKKKEEITPLLKACHSGDDVSIDFSQSSSNLKTPIGTMRHDIPHRWVKSVFWTASPTCEACCEAVSRFSQAYRCKSCHRIVHFKCRDKTGNNCGFPAACANFYIENHKAGPDLMSGWVKVWKRDGGDNKWHNAFACLEGDVLAFYESDTAFVQRHDPIWTVDLTQQRWKIYNQTGAVDGVDINRADCLIEIKVQDISLFMLTMTPGSKIDWIRALQNATNRRILDRNGSGRCQLAPSAILRLPPPLLIFNCTEIYNDWLLIGSPQGLFATPYSSPRMPFQIAGFTNVLQIKWVPEYNLVFLIDGCERHLVALHGLQLDNALNATQSPRVQPTPYNNLPAAHLIVVSEPHHASERYMYVGTSEGITVFRYMAKRDMFAPFHDISCEVPAMCIVSVPGGFVFGADTFYFVSHESWQPSSFRADWPPDCPVSVVKISDEEILLVNHNVGVFTTPQGERTRRGNIEWEHIPLSVNYAAPYLFIIYADMISVVRIRSPEEGGDTLIEDIAGYRAPAAHFTGYGKTDSEIFLTVKVPNCIELNCFNPTKNALKRKPTTTSMQAAKKRF